MNHGQLFHNLLEIKEIVDQFLLGTSRYHKILLRKNRDDVVTMEALASNNQEIKENGNC